jgi:hypothetical protein
MNIGSRKGAKAQREFIITYVPITHLPATFVIGMTAERILHDLFGSWGPITLTCIILSCCAWWSLRAFAPLREPK